MTAFVIMPFADQLRARYERRIRVPLQAHGWTVQRADEVYGSYPILKNVVELLQQSQVVIADLTGRNPNVLFELGLAFAYGKDVVILSSDESDIPIDLRHLNCIVANNISEEKLSSAIVEAVLGTRHRPLDAIGASSTQRIVAGAHQLGIVDMRRADVTELARAALSAKSSFEALGLTGRSIFGVSNDQLRGLHDQLSDKEVTILLPDPQADGADEIDRLDATGENAGRLQIQLSVARFSALGFQVRVIPQAVHWGGVFVDRNRALIQFFTRGAWDTVMVECKDVEKGLFESLYSEYRRLVSQSTPAN